MSENFEKERFWDSVWSKHLEEYLAAPPRCGYWIKAFYPKKYTILEIAGGTCRDSRYLASIGYQVVASDINQAILEYIRQFLNSPEMLVRADAFRLPFRDKSFDITFSNGFWICFDDDMKLYSLIKEQARVTKKLLIAFVHNQANQNLVEIFRKKARHDPLYDIRFFTREGLLRIIKNSGVPYKRIRLHKFGGWADVLYSRRLPYIWQRVAPSIVPTLYRFQPWGRTERIVCVVELS